jgi:hypothetical protein
VILVENLLVHIKLDEVHRFLGYPAGRTPPRRIATMIAPLLEEAHRAIKAKGLALELPAERAVELGLELREAASLSVGMVTLGGALEARSGELLRRGETTAALILEAMGSAAAEEAADRLSARLLGLDETIDVPSVGCRISPGYGGWPLESQAALFELLPAESIGLRLTQSMLMLPRKSISFALWLGPGEAKVRRGCGECDLRRCPFRRARPEVSKERRP